MRRDNNESIFASVLYTINENTVGLTLLQVKNKIKLSKQGKAIGVYLPARYECNIPLCHPPHLSLPLYRLSNIGLY